MSFSAVVMALIGLLLEFFPHEMLDYLGLSSAGIAPLLMQITGALYLGFAMTNWMAKGITIGGIYARPLAIGNFLHFMVSALALIKYAVTRQDSVVWILATASPYCDTIRNCYFQVLSSKDGRLSTMPSKKIDIFTIGHGRHPFAYFLECCCSTRSNSVRCAERG